MSYLAGIKPVSGELYFKGKILNHIHPNKEASLGIGRTFQNLALFNHMTVLENIFVGRHHLLKNSFVKVLFIGFWWTKRRS